MSAHRNRPANDRAAEATTGTVTGKTNALFPWQRYHGISGDDEYLASLAVSKGLVLHVHENVSADTLDDPKLAAENIEAFKNWRADWEAMRHSRLESSPTGDRAVDRSRGLMRWRIDRFAGSQVGARDEDCKDAVWFLAKFVNDGLLSRDEVVEAILDASDANGHSADNKSHAQITRDVDRGLAKAARQGLHVDWSQFPADVDGIDIVTPKRDNKTENHAKESDGDAGQFIPAMALTRLADVEPEQISWLWDGRIPRGKLVTLDGDPGLGKSTLALAVAACVTGTTTWPDGARCADPGAVLVMSAEDGLADTIRPRLDAAGADVTKVYAVQGISVDNEGTLRPTTLADVIMLEEAIVATGARLLIVDVLMAYLPGSADSHRDQDVRAVLSRLAALADRTGCTVLLLRHLTKGGGRDPIYRGGGSIGIVGAARAGFLVACDPDDPARRVLAVVKSNLAPSPPSLAFRLIDASPHGCARVVWDGETDLTATHLLAEPGDSDDEPGGNPAKTFIREYLFSQGGECATSDVIKAGRAAGFSDQELKDARRRSRKPRVLSRKAGFGGGWVWALEVEGGTRTLEGGEGGEGGRAQDTATFDAAMGEGGTTPSASTFATFATLGGNLPPSGDRAGVANDAKSVTISPTQQTENGTEQRANLLLLPTGPGRCTGCGFHTETQGHRPGCQQTNNREESR